MDRKTDKRGRWRNTVVTFRVSKEENKLINDAVALSGMTKQEFIVNKLLNLNTTVKSSPKTYKALNDKMNEILLELKRIASSLELTDDLLDRVELILRIYVHTRGE